MTSDARGQGIGRALVGGLIDASEREGFWTIQAQIMVANSASRALHVACGFREVGIRERYGALNGVWHDVMLLERRSVRTGGTGLPTRVCDSAAPKLAP